MKTLILFLALSSAAMADNWACRTEGSVVIGPTKILVCGMADATSEFEARMKAYSAAMNEFQQVCDSSDECKGRKVFTKPQRTECLSVQDGFRCYRAIEVSISTAPKSLDDEIVNRKIALAESEEQKAKEDGLADLENEARLSKPGASYWNLGFGLLIDGANFKGVDTVQVGYGVTLKRCFFDTVCPEILAMVGKFSENSTYLGSFETGAAGLSVLISSRVYVNALIGLEHSHDDSSQQSKVYQIGMVGVEAIKVKTVSLNVEGGVKTGSQVNTTPIVGVSFNFKF